MSMHMETIWKNNKTILIISIICFLLISCNVEKNRKVLSFFFDGVPNHKKKEDSDSKAALINLENNGKKREIIKFISFHPDYKERNCKKCHDASTIGSSSILQQARCFKCHDNEFVSKKYVHGPVAIESCTSCHVPHSSKYKSLLKLSGRDMCIQCHDDTNFQKDHPRECLSCHVPHSSDNEFLIELDKKSEISNRVNLNKNFSHTSKLLDHKVNPSSGGEQAEGLILTLRSFDHKNFSRFVIELKKECKFKKEIGVAYMKIEFPQFEFIQKINKENNRSIKFLKAENKRDPAILSIKLKNKFEVLNELVLTNPFRIVLDIRNLNETGI